MKAVSPGKGKKAKTDPTEEIWNLRLYVAGQTQKSITAFANLKKICEEHLAGKYRIEVIDLLKNPQLAKGGSELCAIPTLVRKLLNRLKGSSEIWPTRGARAGRTRHSACLRMID